ncbi:cellulose synthase-like protein G2 [Nymphaea colorata]|uniref:cellulose synthase-like protein G2 n=1 Tax=Nymphaea colorata TaxID=210225 RepID=UPI00129DA16A|nr:cellulose synthase-like protein G2 [Nymphaea colorata]
MEKQPGLPTHTVQAVPRIWFNRFHAAVYSCALFAFFYHRLLSLLQATTLLSFTSFLLLTLADLVFSLMWVLSQAFRWTPVRRRAFPDNLRNKLPEAELPALDVFICTADPLREPPIDVANTALSAMAFDYPADKISVYVSDDGGSKLTLLAFIEAARFAKKWVPFCKEHKIRERNPQAYFTSASNGGYMVEGWREMKDMYEEMKERVESAVERGDVNEDQVIHEENLMAFQKWTPGFSRRNHPTVIEVLLAAGKDADAMGHAMPNLVYLSREKSITSHHHFKAGALNTLLRVSSVMSNAPILLNLDCDMYSNDPAAPYRALCFLLDPDLSTTLAFVQFPQIYHGINKNDIYGNEYKRPFQINPLGMDGSGGPNYIGTGCFFQRRAFAGKPALKPHSEIILEGSSTNNGGREPIWSQRTLEAAHRVAGCNYEQGTEWGSSIGFRYGSLVEDFHTGYMLHSEGWRSAFYNPPEPSFLADFPMTLNDVLCQCKRWTVGLLEVSFSCFRCPLTFGLRHSASLIAAMSYAHYSFWPLWCIPITIYALLPQFTLLLGLPIFPKATDPWIFLYVYLFLASYGQDMLEYIMEGSTLARWWNEQRMWMIKGVSSFLFGFLEFLLQQMGIFRSGFNITSKVADDRTAKRYRQGVVDFGVASQMFFSISAAAVISLVALAVGSVRVLLQGGGDEMAVQLFISGFVVLNSWPVFEAMVLRSDSGRMPKRITLFAGFVGYAFFFMAELARGN